MSSPESTSAAPGKGGLFEDLIEVLFSPFKVFDRTRAAAAFKYVAVTTVMVAIVSYATMNLLQPWLDAQADLAIAQATAKAAQGGSAMPEQAVSGIRASTKWSMVIGAPVLMLIGPYFNAAFLMLGALLMKVKVSYSQAAVIAVLGGVPRILGVLAMPVQAVLLSGENAKGIFDLSLGPARFVDPSTMSPAILSLLGQLDLFRVWQLALIAIGVAVVGRVSMGTAAVVAVIMAAITAILQLAPTALL